jgi:C-terminal processing protease CtpA/Prc
LALIACCGMIGVIAVSAQGNDKKEEAKKPAVKEEPKAIPLDELKAKLKKQEEEVVKIRRAMLKEIEEHDKQLAEEIKKAKDAGKKGDRDGYALAAKLQIQKAKLQTMRMEIETRIRVDLPTPARPALPVDQQLGLATTLPNATLRAQLGLAKDQGLILERVTQDSPADKVGLKSHDILVQVGDAKVPSDPVAFRKLLAGQKAGEPFDVTVIRQGKQETVKGLTVPAPK